jgi:predicted dehydrogenase
MGRYRVALIGTGVMGRVYHRACLSEKARVDVVAVADSDVAVVAQFAEANGIRHFYTDAQRLLDEQQPDLVIVATPPETHASLSVAALNTGAHVLCEKPITTSLHALDLIQQTELRTGRTCSSIVHWRFGSGAIHAKQMIASGVLGSALLASCQTTWYRPPDYYNLPWRKNWAEAAGGFSFDMGIHNVDLMLWLVGDWQQVSAFMATLDREIEVENVSLAHVRFANGAVGSVINSGVSPREESSLRLDFQHATIDLNHLYEHTNANWRFSATPGKKELEDVWHAIPNDVCSRQGHQVTVWLDSLDAGQTPLATGHEIRRTLEFITALYKSAMTGRPVVAGEIVAGDPWYDSLHGAQVPSFYRVPFSAKHVQSTTPPR